MKKFCLVTAIVVFLSRTLCSCNSYKPNEVVYVYNWGEYIDPTVNEQFEKEYGIKVIYDEYDNNESMYASLKNGAAKYDVVFPSDYMVSRLIREDMLEPLDFDNIPNYQYIMEKFKGMNYDPEQKYSVPYMWGVIALLYNTKYVDKAPESWDILWDEQYNGKVLMYNNSRDAIGISLIKNGNSVNTSNKYDIKNAADDILKLKDNLQAFVSDEIFARMESGSAYITPAYGGDALAMMEENPDLDYVIPKEGSNLYVDSMCIVKGSKNKQAAEKYINFLCRYDIASLNREEIWYSTPHQQVYDSLDADVKNELIAYPPEELNSKLQVYSDLTPEILEYYTDQWINIKNK